MPRDHDAGDDLDRAQAAIIPRPLISFSKIRRLRNRGQEPGRPAARSWSFDLSIARHLPADTRFFTLLRDPVERAISHYYHYRRRTVDSHIRWRIARR